MSLLTKCAHCGTTFRVTQQQLQAHNGKVRCGSCMTVFNGLEALVALPETPEGIVQGAGGIVGIEPAALAPASAAPMAGRTVEALRGRLEYDLVPEPPAFDEAPLTEEELRQRRGWALGATLLGILLAVQAVYFYRSDLAAQYPGLKPYLVQLCASLRCTIAPPQRPKQIAIEASDLQAAETGRPGLIQLTATLRNHAGYELGYPALDLVLTNTKEHTVARRVFLPKEYLERGRNPAAGIPANAEITVRLDLDTGDLNPAGFRLDLLPAPVQ
jgi:predicted Zn finger-like uncharacterized protein